MKVNSRIFLILLCPLPCFSPIFLTSVGGKTPVWGECGKKCRKKKNLQSSKGQLQRFCLLSTSPKATGRQRTLLLSFGSPNLAELGLCAQPHTCSAGLRTHSCAQVTIHAECSTSARIKLTLSRRDFQNPEILEDRFPIEINLTSSLEKSSGTR